MRLSRLLIALSAGAIVVTPAPKPGKAGTAGVEIRWFFRGDLPADVRHWFTQNGSARGPFSETDEDKRHDVYLVVQGDKEVGLKLRGNELELKQLRDTLDVRFSGGRISGRAEVWAKWEWSVTPREVAKKHPKGVQREVGKKRLQRTFEAGGAGCVAEITALAVGDERWWTIAAGLPGSDPVTIKGCAEEVFRDYPGPALDGEHSLSYPAWLDSLGTN